MSSGFHPSERMETEAEKGTEIRHDRYTRSRTVCHPAKIQAKTLNRAEGLPLTGPFPGDNPLGEGAEYEEDGKEETDLAGTEVPHRGQVFISERSGALQDGQFIFPSFHFCYSNSIHTADQSQAWPVVTSIMAPISATDIRGISGSLQRLIWVITPSPQPIPIGISTAFSFPFPAAGMTKSASFRQRESLFAILPVTVTSVIKPGAIALLRP